MEDRMTELEQELLAALKLCEKLLSELKAEGAPIALDAEVSAAKAAIAKAEGK
jgi:hypothetical protein